jgi:hypothetical protein
MRQALFFSLLVLIFFPGCHKDNRQPDTVLIDMSIISTNTPESLAPGQDIISNVKCSGTDLCYHFSKFDIKESAPAAYEIRAKAIYPNCSQGDCVCLDAMYYADTSLSIHTPVKGQYILKFFSNNVFFKADTVRVN